MKKKFYAVKVGRHPGIYRTWDECKKEVDGISGAVYKGFSLKREAEAFLSGEEEKVEPDDVDATIYVDGSYDNRFGIYGYGCVVVPKDGEIQTFGNAGNNSETALLRNVAGEMWGAMEAVLFSKRKGYKSIRLCYDYRGIEDWVTGAWDAKNAHTFVYACRMREFGKAVKIHFKKVKAHTGVEYNEMADGIAKDAVLKLANQIYA